MAPNPGLQQSWLGVEEWARRAGAGNHGWSQKRHLQERGRVDERLQQEGDAVGARAQHLLQGRCIRGCNDMLQPQRCQRRLVPHPCRAHLLTILS